jgi:hypothetical protein
MPDGSADTVLMTDAIFNQTVAQSEYTYAYMSLYNDSLWAKTATGNTAWHMRNNLQNMMSGGVGTTPYKFALFSAHDTSVMPFLAAILGDAWDGRWAGYAYLVSLELYTASATSDLGAGNFYFRLVYNGKALLVPGCTDTLCDANVLLDVLSYGQQSMPCSVSDDEAVVTDDDDSSGCDGGDDDDGALSPTHWGLLIMASAITGMLVGAAGVVFLERRRKSADDMALANQVNHL